MRYCTPRNNATNPDDKGGYSIIKQLARFKVHYNAFAMGGLLTAIPTGQAMSDAPYRFMVSEQSPEEGAYRSTRKHSPHWSRLINRRRLDNRSIGNERRDTLPAIASSFIVASL